MNDTVAPEAAHRIRVERKRLGMSQDEAAMACGSSREMWGRYERGAYPMPTTVMRSFIDAGADADFLRTGIRSSVLNALAYSGADKQASALGIENAIQMIQDALGAAPPGFRMLQVSEREHELVLAYRHASQERREVFDDLIYAAMRRATV